jgi:hypothetical protein
LLGRHQSLTQLAQLVSALEEPYRSTVLLRYGEELTPAEIARRYGLPAGTVRWRLKQGLDRLRVEMDRAQGSRRAWAGLASPAYGSKAILSGVVGMKIGGKGAVAVVIALLLVVTAAVLVGREARHRGLLGSAGPTPGGPPAAGVAAPPPTGEGEDASHRARSKPPRFVGSLVEASAEAPGSAADKASPRERSVAAIPLDRRYDLTQAEREALARNCEVRTDLPGVRTVNDVPLGWLGEKDLAAMDLAPGELPLVREAIRRYRDALDDLSRRWYVEVTADAAGARGLQFLDFSNPDDPACATAGQAPVACADRRGCPADGRGAGRLEIARHPTAARHHRGQRCRLLPPAARPRRRLRTPPRRRCGPARARQLRRGAISGHTRKAGCP